MIFPPQKRSSVPQHKPAALSANRVTAHERQSRKSQVLGNTAQDVTHSLAPVLWLNSQEFLCISELTKGNSHQRAFPRTCGISFLLSTYAGQISLKSVVFSWGNAGFIQGTFNTKFSVMLDFNIPIQYHKCNCIIKDSIWQLNKFPDAWSKEITAPSANMDRWVSL